jgi:hypothetical protein
MGINEYIEEFMTNLRADAALNHTDAADEFYDWSLNVLQENGEFQDPILFYFGGTHIVTKKAHFIRKADCIVRI